MIDACRHRCLVPASVAPLPHRSNQSPLVVAHMPSEQQVAAVQAFDDRRRCRRCGMAFPSRTQLFDHLHASGHEADQVSPAVLDAVVLLGRGV